jgi:hypothetical protein
MSKKSSSLEYYDSIDLLPVLNWDKIINGGGDYSWLLHKRRKLNKRLITQLSKAWEIIYDEYIRTFGIGDAFERALRMKVKIAQMRMKKILTGDENLQTFIDVEEMKLSTMEQNAKGGDIYKAKAAIEKKMGIRIPLAETPVREFYSYLKDMK